MDFSKIKAVIVAVVTTFLALYLGVSAATAQFEAVAWVLGVAGFAICLLLGRRIWLLIPFMAALDIGLRLPGQPDSLLLGQLLVIGFCIFLFLLRKLDFRIIFGEIELLMLVLALVVVQAYLRNPVGLNIFGGMSVGGKPYFIFAITCMSTVILCGIKVPEKHLAYILRLSIIGGVANLVIGVAGQFVPAIAYLTGASYTNSSEVDYTRSNAPIDERASGRIGYFAILSKNLSLWIVSFISPIRAILRPMWITFCMVALAAGALSGFRTCLMAVLVTFLIGIFYRDGWRYVVIGLFGFAACIVLLVAVNLIVPLPPNVQRSLSFLPGTWEERYKKDGASSTEWRMEMWKDALFTDLWIKNKWLGDGLGFTGQELARIAKQQYGASATRATAGADERTESFLISGNYHSTIVSTVRTCGYLGVLFLLVTMFRISIHANRLIVKCRQTPWFPLALFVGIPPIMAFAFFAISAITFLQVTSTLFLSAGLIRMLHNNLPHSLQESGPHRAGMPNGGTGKPMPAILQARFGNQQSTAKP
jgi:hypothetical protein